MKPIFKRIFFICSILSFHSLYAQVNFGLEIGITGSNQLNAYHASSGYKTGNSLIGFREGVFAEIYLNKKWVFRPAAMGDMEGTKIPAMYDGQGTLITKEQKIKLVYFKLPLEFLYVSHFSFGDILAGGGPYTGVLGSVQINGSRPGNNDKARYGYRLFDFGISAEAYIETKIGVIAGINYMQGLTATSPTNTKARNIMGSIFVGYVLPIQ